MILSLIDVITFRLKEKKIIHGSKAFYRRDANDRFREEKKKKKKRRKVCECAGRRGADANSTGEGFNKIV